tara:strand:- start:561 stop:941 length:381 start_codon:yes stop_codon:yes gene_type:complete
MNEQIRGIIVSAELHKWAMNLPKNYITDISHLCLIVLIIAIVKNFQPKEIQEKLFKTEILGAAVQPQIQTAAELVNEKYQSTEGTAKMIASLIDQGLKYMKETLDGKEEDNNIVEFVNKELFKLNN